MNTDLTTEGLIELARERRLIERSEKRGDIYYLQEFGIQLSMPESRARRYLRCLIRRAEKEALMRGSGKPRSHAL